MCYYLIKQSHMSVSVKNKEFTQSPLYLNRITELNSAYSRPWKVMRKREKCFWPKKHVATEI